MSAAKRLDHFGDASSQFDGLSEEELLTLIGPVLERIVPFGLEVPVDWRDQLVSDPAAFLAMMQPQFEAIKESRLLAGQSRGGATPRL